jgi:hypothetical protein
MVAAAALGIKARVHVGRGRTAAVFETAVAGLVRRALDGGVDPGGL